MKVGAKRWFELFKNAGMDWSNDRAPQLGAALAFYTIFSLAPLLTIIISIASLWFTQNASGQVFHQLGSVIGTDSAAKLQEMLVQPNQKASGIFTTISAAVMLILGATGVFTQLQDSLNQVWEVRPKPGQGVMGFIRHRLLSFGMVLGIAFLLLVSLVLSTAMAAIGKYFSHMLGNTSWIFEILNNVVSFGLISLLFAMMFKYVPDAEVSWKDVWFGAIFTAALFTIGKFGLGMYLGKNSVVSTYKAAGALLIVLLWVYYSAQILFYGAELTQEYAEMRGRSVKPSPHAEMDEEKRCQSEAAEAYQEKKAKQKQASNPQPQPAYAMGSAMSGVAGHMRQSHSRKLWGSLILLGIVLYPIQKKLSAAKALLKS
jgi:membrane protein